MDKTTGIVLRSIKYGDTSLITTIFTQAYGIQGFMVQGVRTSKVAGNKAGMLQPATLLDMIIYHQPQRTLQRMREFTPYHLYQSIQQDIIKNSVALFSVEVLLRLLPEHAPMPELHDFVMDYFVELDKAPRDKVANFPLFFTIMCSRFLGYELKERYSIETPHLNLQEGGFTAHPPALVPFMSDDDARAIDKFLPLETLEAVQTAEMSSAMRSRLLEWYISFLQQHTQHMGNIKSLAVLQTILH